MATDPTSSRRPTRPRAVPAPPADPAADHPTDPRRGVGAAGERFAEAHLLRLGYDVVERNARTRWGEIDLVVVDERALVFCEVKARVARGHASPWTSLHARKQAQVRRLAAAWLAEREDRPRARDLRFDAIGVLLDPSGRLVRLDHLEGAF